MNMVTYTTTYDPTYGSMLGGIMAFMGTMWLVTMIISIVCIIGLWKVYSKAGRPGWAALIPFYNQYVLFDIALGSGWKFLTLLIPFYNIYMMFKVNIELAHVFGESTGYGIGLVFLQPIFICLLGFGKAQYAPAGQYTESSYSQAIISSEDAKAAALAKLKARQQEINDKTL